ncbi:MAG: hypothetical protein EON93_03785 [Burkholderiales bacterium]|nr:MAG: hypothetical protein EON93_03785 [Burkholderiales bacterium]
MQAVRLLELEQDWSKAMDFLAGDGPIYVIGRGPGLAVAAEAAEEEERAVEDAMLLEAIEEAIEDDIIDDDIIEDDIIDDDIMEDDAAALEAEADDPPTAAPPAEPSAPRTPP